MQKLDQDIISLQNDNQNVIKPTSLKIKKKCVGGNLLHSFCFNKYCQQQTNFLCHDDQCKCNQNHQLCEKGHIKFVLNKINQKFVNNTNELKSDINKVFTNLSNQISQFQEYLIKLVDENLKFIQLMDLEKQKIENIQKFDAEQLSKLLEIIGFNNQNCHFTDQLFEDFFYKFNNLDNTLTQLLDNKKDQIDQFMHIILEKKIKEQQITKIKTPFYSQNYTSSILKHKQDLYILVNFFPKKIKSLDLVFRAKDYQFQISDYFEQCGDLQNTIIICLTKKDKIIGGYTPLSFNPIDPVDKWAVDQSKTSFIFSLNNNHKFQLKNKQNAIYRYVNKNQICFGNNNLVISDNGCNYSKGNSKTNLDNICYFNENYKHNKQSYLKLNGHQGEKFAVKQWEVFQVQFRQDKQPEQK